jgi:glucosyl-dolichyl phosphate glucuronosyltransferase
VTVICPNPEQKYPSISVVIPTYNRAKDLKETLSSIFDQTADAREILVVDDSDNNETELLIDSLNQLKQVKGSADLFYIRNRGEKSATIARNLGIRMARGDIVLFLDDDINLDKNYFSEIGNVFGDMPGAKGAQGWMVQEHRKGFINGLLRMAARAFYLGHTVDNQCRAYPSTNVTYPHTLDRVISCEWLHGCNCAVRREALEEFNFDEKLKGYTWKEDLDISYRIYRKYPGSLYITPKARLIHKESPSGRRPLKQVTYIKEAYTLYVFFKDFDHGLKDRIIFIWSKLGALPFLLFTMRSRSCRDVLSEAEYWLRAQLLCVRYWKEIRKGNFGFIAAKMRDDARD